jgi:hypothetical protein
VTTGNPVYIHSLLVTVLNYNRGEKGESERLMGQIIINREEEQRREGENKRQRKKREEGNLRYV